MEKLILIGAGRSAEFIYEFIKFHKLYDVIGFAVNSKYMDRAGKKFKGLPVYKLETIKEDLKNVDFKVFITLMWNKLNSERKKLFEYCESEKLEMVSLISPNVVNFNAKIGRNCLIFDYCILEENSRICDDAMLVGANIVGAKSTVGAHTFMAFQSVVAGGVKVGEQSFLGIHSTVNEFVTIGEKCIVGSGVTVKYDLEPCSKIALANETFNIKKYDLQTIEGKLVAK